MNRKLSGVAAVKQKQKKLRRSTLCILCAAVLTAALCFRAGCAAQKDSEITSLSQLNEPGRSIAVSTDAPEGSSAEEDFPEAEILKYIDLYPVYKDVANGKVDAVLYAREQMEIAMENGVSGVRLLDENYRENIIAVALSRTSPIPDIQEKINSFIKELKDDGTLDDMYERWVIRGDETMPEIDVPENSSVHLHVGTTGTVMPYSYYTGTELNGYDIELARRFAAWLGADLEFKVYDFIGVISAAQAGDVDCVMSNLFYTEEHEESVDFSDPLFTVEITAMVRDTGASGETASKDLNDGIIGTFTGTNFQQILEEYYPNAEFVYFNSLADSISALESGKIDALAMDEPSARSICAEKTDITYSPELPGTQGYAYVLQKGEAGEALCGEISEYIEELEEDGTLQELQEKWFDSPDPASLPSEDYRDLPAEKGTIRAATSQYVPFAIFNEDMYTGYEVELLTMFCKRYGYALSIEEVNTDGILPSVESGKADIGFCSFSITPERQETMLFTSPHYIGGTALLVMKEASAQGGTGFWEGVRNSFEKTFLRENRWKLFLQGIGTTMLITVLSIIFGTLLGFGVFMLCRRGNRAANAVTRFSVWLVQGMPVVVLLMILYYVIFGKVNISGTIVSVMGFTLIFGAGVYSLMKTSTAAVDRGQEEAALALGYKDRKAFYKVIFPQALPHFIPGYKGEITSLIKATAIVGYIAVQDLTKMADIVRSRTYDAFFPLIVIAIIYFILAAVLTFIVNRIEIHIDLRRRKKKALLRGVKL